MTELPGPDSAKQISKYINNYCLPSCTIRQQKGVVFRSCVLGLVNDDHLNGFLFVC